nr:putative ribonuclease H-like domain-containing protein [Tanacetum cinerariifolium]
MESQNLQVVAAAKLPILNPNEFDLWKMRIEQFFLMTDYALWEVILNGDSPTPTRVVDGVVQAVAATTAEQKLAKKNELKVSETLLMALPDKHQLNFNIHKDVKSLMEAIEKRFDGNKETKKVQKTLLKQQYENFSGSSSDSLDQIYDKLQKLISQLEILVSVVPSVFAASTKPPVSALPNVDNLSDAVIYSFFASQSTSPQLDNDDLKQIDANDLKEMDLKWHMAMLTMRAKRFLQRTGRNLGANGTTYIWFDMSKVECYNFHRRGYFARECRSPRDTRNKDTQRRSVPVETSTSNALVSQCDGVSSYDWSFQADKEPTNYALMAFTSSSSSSFDNEVAPHFKACSKAYATLQLHYDKLTVDFRKPQFDVLSYKSGLESVEARLVVYQHNENVFEEDIKLLKLDVMLRDNALVKLRKNFKKAEKERDDSESDVSVPTSLVHDRYKSGKGYHVVPPPYTGTFMPPKPGLVFHDALTASETILNVFNVEPSTPKPSKDLSQLNRPSAPIIEDWVSDSKDKSEDGPIPTQKAPRNLQHTLKDKGVIDSGCSIHMTGNISYLSDFEEINKGYVAFDGNPKGDNECVVLSSDFMMPDENHVLLRVPRENNMYNVDLKNIVPLGDLTCIFAKATLDESNLWHRRLGYINFKTLNKLVKDNLVRGLPSKVFENNHTCVACKKGKQHKTSYKSKPVNSVSQPLQRLHMDLFGPTCVKSLNKKSYCLVVTDDYSRFSWVFFLATKDETSTILKTFITGIENQINHNVKIIRIDNTTEFKNHDLNQFCGMKGIKREFSVARTPQQNGVAERKNRTLIEASRTMLSDLLLPIPFWTEAVNIVCYVQNMVLVTKPHNKTPYELLLGRTPSIRFIRPFGYPVTILNTLDPLGEFDRKADEGFLVGYSVSSKAFRVFNSRTIIVQETLHINFLENQPDVAGNRPTWLFDIDTLIQSMNYQPVNTDVDVAFDVKENEPKVYVSPSSSDKPKKHDEKAKREAKGKSLVDLSTGIRDLSDEFEEFSVNSTNRVNAVSAPVTTVRPNSTNSTNSFEGYEIPQTHKRWDGEIKAEIARR